MFVWSFRLDFADDDCITFPLVLFLFRPYTKRLFNTHVTGHLRFHALSLTPNVFSTHTSQDTPFSRVVSYTKRLFNTHVTGHPVFTRCLLHQTSLPIYAGDSSNNKIQFTCRVALFQLANDYTESTLLEQPSQICLGLV